MERRGRKGVKAGEEWRLGRNGGRRGDGGWEGMEAGKGIKAGERWRQGRDGGRYNRENELF